jgi:glycosyltransferase involved in cell wall biosynthesis
VVGTEETVADGETGFLVPLDDVEAMAGRLVQLIDDPALRRRMGEAGRAWVEAHFDEDVIVEALAGTYRQLLASPGAIPAPRLRTTAP